MSKRILVTGGAGYVGAHCCKAFAAEGWEVSVFDNLSSGRSSFVRWGELIEGNVLDRAALDAAMAKVQPHAVAHFAGLTSIEGSRRDPGRYYRTNSLGTLNLLEAMRVADVPYLVYSSSGEVYGEAGPSPISESQPPSPINPYGWSKYFAERAIADLGEAHGIKAIILRYFNAAGADPDDMLGDRYRPGRHLIERAISATDPQSIYEVRVSGLSHATPDGTCIRDFIHVTDVASAHAAALEYLVLGGEAQVLNLGSGQGHSVRQIIDAVDRKVGREVRYTIALRPNADPPMLVADPARARAILSWRTRFSDLEQMVHDALKWHRVKGKQAVKPKPKAL